MNEKLTVGASWRHGTYLLHCPLHFIVRTLAFFEKLQNLRQSSLIGLPRHANTQHALKLKYGGLSLEDPYVCTCGLVAGRDYSA